MASDGFGWGGIRHGVFDVGVRYTGWVDSNGGQADVLCESVAMDLWMVLGGRYLLEKQNWRKRRDPALQVARVD
ncbi:hypothetical protein RvY_16711 [Ramazzottius varieornatus]|uniref:Uncharacterized protein n=1 Tax=Ramazzottius varieornatus TaxID=947166 RepID=A0A1D1VZH9_RAMVA|nr:hypothetical protein RvY_16711 [Ramazzottius varieornatus]